MLWLTPPPVFRWTLAGLIVLVAMWIELAPGTTGEVVILAEDVPIGTELGPDHIRRIRTADPTIRTVEPIGYAATDLKEGDPLVASLISEVSIPPGWVTIEAPVPGHASPGRMATAVVVSLGQEPITIDAVVATAGSDDGFGDTTGTIAIPPQWVATAAAAAARGELVIGVGGSNR